MEQFWHLGPQVKFLFCLAVKVFDHAIGTEK